MSSSPSGSTARHPPNPVTGTDFRTFVSSDYEEAQRLRLLRALLAAAFAGFLFTGAVNMLNGWRGEASVLLAASVACLMGLGLTRARRYTAASLTLSVTMLLGIDAALYFGAGLYDEGVIAYPLFMVCVTFLFSGELAVLSATAAAVASLAAIYILEVAGRIVVPTPSTPLRLVFLSVLVVLSGVVLRAIRRAWEAIVRQVYEAGELSLEGWARALEYRDGVTAGHTRRVAELGMRLARRLHCSHAEVIAIGRGAWLHDIGKMAISDGILRKNGPLTPEELEIMRQHTTLGREFVRGLSFLGDASTIPYSHHERWDGSGYPDGLRAEEIPLAARIFAVVDNWDALSSDRPYRKALPRAEVVAHLRRNAGTMFDPRIVEAFLELMEARDGTVGELRAVDAR